MLARGHEQKHSDWDAYSRSKLLDLMAAQELNRRLYGATSTRNWTSLLSARRHRVVAVPVESDHRHSLLLAAHAGRSPRTSLPACNQRPAWSQVPLVLQFMRPLAASTEDLVLGSAGDAPCGSVLSVEYVSLSGSTRLRRRHKG